MVKTTGCTWAKAAGRTETTIAARQANVFLLIGKFLSLTTDPGQYIAAIVPDSQAAQPSAFMSRLSLTCDRLRPKIADHWPSCLADYRVRSQHGASTAPSTSTTVPTPTRSKGQLLRIVGVGFGVAVGIGGMVGSGILRTPGQVVAQLHSARLVIAVWALGGVYAFFSTLSVTELGTMLPQEGGWYVYSRQAFGEYVGFVVGCCDWMMQTVPIAYLAVAFGEFAAALEPGLGRHIKLVAVASVVILTLLNWLGLRAGSRAQELTSLLKALAMIAFVVACFAVSPRSGTTDSSAIASFPASRGSILLALVVALQAVIVTYDGWYSPIYFMEEDQDPTRNLPRSAIGGAVACIAIFLLVNLALLHVLPMDQLAASRAPAADAAMAVFGRAGKQIILVISLVTVVSTINACLLVSSRILFALSRDGLLPYWMALVNSGGTPSGALLVGAFISVALVLGGSFETVAGPPASPRLWPALPHGRRARTVEDELAIKNCC
jgi:APA family basic amino acid/polyamine antiporter